MGILLGLAPWQSVMENGHYPMGIIFVQPLLKPPFPTVCSPPFQNSKTSCYTSNEYVFSHETHLFVVSDPHGDLFVIVYVTICSLSSHV